MAWDKLSSPFGRHCPRGDKETISIMSEPLPGFKQNYHQNFMTYPDVPEISPRFMRAINREAPFHTERYKIPDDSAEGIDSSDEKLRTSTSSSSTCSTKKTTINLLADNSGVIATSPKKKRSISEKLFQSQYVQVGKEVEEFWPPDNCIRCKGPIMDGERKRNGGYLGEKTISIQTSVNGMVEIKLCLRYKTFLTMAMIVSGLVLVSLAIGWPGCFLGCSRKLVDSLFNPKPTTIYSYIFP